MMKQKELIFSVAQRRGSMNDNSNGLVDQSTVESLKGFLQEMSGTIQSLTIRHNSVCQKYKRLALSNADSHTPSAGGVSLPSHETPVSHQWCHTGGATMNGLRNGLHLRNLAFQAQELMISQSDQSRASAAATSGRCNGCSHQGMYRAQEMKSMDMDIGMGSEQVSRKWHQERSFQKLPINDVTVDEFQSFLEEMKNTIQIWSSRHRSLVQGCQLAKKKTEVASTCCVEPPRGKLTLQISPQIQEDEAVVNTVQPASSPAFSQHVTEGGVADPSYALLHFCESKQSPEFVSDLVPGNSQNSQQSSDDKGALSIVNQLTSDIFHDGQGEPKMCVSHHGSITAAEPSTSCRVHRVVESPDWLPYGWITEVKTRANGSSAGTKDKYYFDPISKRRFRSRKEVFCFLTTGNSGRYKPRPKAQSNEGESNRDPTHIAQPTSSSYQLLTGQTTPLHFGFLPYYSFPSMSGPLPFFYASGFYRNFLLPFKPSQPSEGLMHERWFNVPVPMSEHFQCNGIEKEAYRLYEHCAAGPSTDPLYHNGVTATVDEGRLKHCVPGLYTFREGHSWADGGIANSTNFSERSWQTEQSQPSGFAVSHGLVNSQAAASQLLEKKEIRNLKANARFSPRHGDLYGLKLPARKLKKVKSHGKEGLEALGKVICQQGLTILRGSKN